MSCPKCDLLMFKTTTKAPQSFRLKNEEQRTNRKYILFSNLICRKAGKINHFVQYFINKHVFPSEYIVHHARQVHQILHMTNKSQEPDMRNFADAADVSAYINFRFCVKIRLECRHLPQNVHVWKEKKHLINPEWYKCLKIRKRKKGKNEKKENKERRKRNKLCC